MIDPPTSSSPKEVAPLLVAATENVFKNTIDTEQTKRVPRDVGDKTINDTKQRSTSPSQK
jgi:hypothetical protein